MLFTIFFPKRQFIALEQYSLSWSYMACNLVPTNVPYLLIRRNRV